MLFTNSEIIAFPDRDKDGIADAAIVAAGGLGMAHSLAFYQDAMYVAEARQITRLRDEDSLLIQSQQRPVGLVPAHLAPMGIHFYTGDLFPAK